MRPFPNPKVERYRVTDGPAASDSSFGANGVFVIPYPGMRATLFVIASDGMGWEHVSVSLNTRCPTWSEMCYIKDLFWDEEEAVMQLHPPPVNMGKQSSLLLTSLEAYRQNNSIARRKTGWSQGCWHVSGVGGFMAKKHKHFQIVTKAGNVGMVKGDPNMSQKTRDALGAMLDAAVK